MFLVHLITKEIAFCNYELSQVWKLIKLIKYKSSTGFKNGSYIAHEWSSMYYHLACYHQHSVIL